MPKTLDLLCLGNPCADIVIRCDRAPAFDDKCVGTALGTFAGGTEANVACAARRLGWRTAVLGEVGDDAQARFLLDAFAADGVQTRWVTPRAGAASASTVLLVSPSGERAIVWLPLPRPAWPPAGLDDALSASRVAYTMPYDIGDLARLHEAARRHGTELAIDVEREAAQRPGQLAALLAHCDIAFMNESGYTAGVGQPPDAAGLQALRASGRAHTVVVTRGAAGALAADAHGVVTVPAWPAQVVDTTGAGDSFNAAWLVARGQQRPMADALRFAAAAASHTVGRLGARSALPTLSDVQVALGTLPPAPVRAAS